MTIRDGVKHGSTAVLSGGVVVSHGKVLGERTLSSNSPNLKEGAEHIEPPTTQVKSQNLKVSQFFQTNIHTAVLAVNTLGLKQIHTYFICNDFLSGMTGREKPTPRRFVTLKRSTVPGFLLVIICSGFATISVHQILLSPQSDHSSAMQDYKVC